MLTRRALLAAGAALPLAACTDSPAPRPTPAPVDPDVALRAAAQDRETALLQAYDDAVAVVPALAALLAPLRADHEAHLVALGVVIAAPTASPSSAVPSAAALPTDPGRRKAAVLDRLVGAERLASKAHATGALAASPGLAALLGQLAASEASHPVGLA